MILHLLEKKLIVFWLMYEPNILLSEVLCFWVDFKWSKSLTNGTQQLAIEWYKCPLWWITVAFKPLCNTKPSNHMQSLWSNECYMRVNNRKSHWNRWWVGGWMSCNEVWCTYAIHIHWHNVALFGGQNIWITYNSFLK